MTLFYELYYSDICSPFLKGLSGAVVCRLDYVSDCAYVSDWHFNVSYKWFLIISEFNIFFFCGSMMPFNKLQLDTSALQHESYKRTNTAMQYFLSFSCNHKITSHGFGFLLEGNQLVTFSGPLELLGSDIWMQNTVCAGAKERDVGRIFQYLLWTDLDTIRVSCFLTLISKWSRFQIMFLTFV